MPKHYTKSALTFEEQLSRLANRGLTISDPKQALMQLSSISYYRLSAYWYPLRQKDQHGAMSDHFAPGAKFDTAIVLYEFDRQLRLLVMDAIERVEIAVRTYVTYYMGHTYGTFAHIDTNHFHDKFDHSTWLTHLEKEIQRSSDEFIRHYRQKYKGFPRVPIWMATEIMSLGSLSRCFKGIRNDKSKVKKQIADHFQVHYKRLEDWLHTLTYIRNICAHHSRLWNRELAIRPSQVKDVHWKPPLTPRNDRIFYVLLILRYLTRVHTNGDDWKTKVGQLINPMTQQTQYRAAMGIPKGWYRHPVWR